MQDDHAHERALAQFEELMGLRRNFLGHKSVLVSIDHAIGNVFEARNHDEISKHITKIKELVDLVAKMNNLRVGSTGIRLHLPNLHVSEANPKYQKINAKYEKLKKIGDRLAVLGISTVGVETAMLDVLMKHCAALLEEPTPAKGKSPYTGIKSESSEHVPGQSAGLDSTTPVCKTETASTMKSASVNDAEAANSENVSEGESNGTKRRKASLDVTPSIFSHSSSMGKYGTEAWRIPVNEIATEGLRIVSKGPNRSLMLYSTTKSSSFVVAFNDECLSTKYPCLELMPIDIQTVMRNSLKTKKDLKARLLTKNIRMKPHSFDIIFSNTEDYEAFVEKVQIPMLRRLDSSCPPSDVMEKMFQEGLWLEKRTMICGRAAKTRTMEIVELA